ncbi:MAG TPA: hypothetical protein VF635_10255 [Propionibacteriaceae bacterium]|jgi:hypothetical protein
MSSGRDWRPSLDRYALNNYTYPPERNLPFFVLLLGLGLNLLPTALGLQAPPGSLEQTQPNLVAQASCALSSAGCLLSCLGIVWPKRDKGLQFEIAGKLLLFFGLSFYAVALWEISTTANGAYVVPLTAGLAVACLVRVGQISLYVRGRWLRSHQENPREPT